MSPALLEAPVGRRGAGAVGGRRPTLEGLLDATWHSVRSHGEADCPVCQEKLHLDGGLARCGRCGTTLS